MVKARTNAGTRGVLRKKLFRDMGGSFMQFLAMFLLCALGTWVFTGLDAAWRMQDVTIESYIEDQNLADFWVQGSSFSKQDISRMRNVRGVSDLQARITLEADCPDLDGKVTAAVHAVQGKMTINTPVIREGEMLSPSDTRGCMVEEQFASAQGLEVGDTLTLEVNDVRYTFIVRALVLSPEYLLTVKDMSPDPATYGFVLLSAEALPAYPDRSSFCSVSEVLMTRSTGSYPSALFTYAHASSSHSEPITVMVPLAIAGNALLT